MRKTSPEGHVIKTGVTPKGRKYMTKQSKSGDRYTEVQGKKAVAVKMNKQKKIFR